MTLRCRVLLGLALSSLLPPSAACSRSSTPAPEAGLSPVPPPPASSSVAIPAIPIPSGSAAEQPRITMTFSGRIGKDSTFALELERVGDRARGVYVVDGKNHPVRVRGTWRGDGVVSLEEVAAKGGAHLDGRIKGNTLTGTWRDKRSKSTQPVSAGPLTPFAQEKDFKYSYLGTLGKATRIRAKLEKQGSQLTGTYRYTRSKNDLKLTGTVLEDSGKALLTETDAKGAITGRFEGTFLSPQLLSGSWLSPEGDRVLPVLLEWTEAYPESESIIVQESPKARVVPLETYDQHGAYCTSTILYPQFEGLKSASAQTALNKSLREAVGPATMDKDQCQSASEESPAFQDGSWSLSRKKGKFIGVVLSTYSSGGAHPVSSSECWVANVVSGQLFRLQTLLSTEGRAKLPALVTERLRAKHKVQDLTELGFYSDPVSLGSKPDLCLAEDGSLRVQMDPYEVAPYALGEQEASLTGEEARALVSSPDAEELFPK